MPFFSQTPFTTNKPTAHHHHQLHTQPPLQLPPLRLRSRLCPHPVSASANAPASPCASVPDFAPTPASVSAPASAADAIAGKNTSKVDVDLADLGGGTTVSRYHARIFYDFPRRRFSLEVLDRNDCYLEGVLHLPGYPPVKLNSQDHLRIGQKDFYFLLPSRGITRRPRPFHAPPPMAPPLAGPADLFHAKHVLLDAPATQEELVVPLRQLCGFHQKLFSFLLRTEVPRLFLGLPNPMPCGDNWKLSCNISGSVVYFRYYEVGIIFLVQQNRNSV
ncbi:hypothetical protein RIF29_39848 [Crotalaria pallida]|uniref:FHA domain-containing protein n=1 Tax=Crotalaria pallida TaxID=3830 RepID=A0AAN9E514_CROPI